MYMNMKKVIYLFSIIFAFSLSGCDKFLDAPSKSTLDESVVFANIDLATMTVDAILEPMGQTNSYRGRFITHYGANTDVEWLNSSNSASARSDLSRYVNSSINTDMNGTTNVWAYMYTGIERANLCIRGLKNYGNPTPGSDFGELLGEALTYRAIYYADLLKTWGDVPARFEPISGATMYIAKSSRDVIYKQIIADLKEAEDLVGWPNSSARTATTEGINKAFIKAFRARLCLAAAGYSQYPTTDGASELRRSNDPELAVNVLYPIALQECKDVIASGKASLTSSFKDFWVNVCRDGVEAGGESLWEIPFADGRGRVAYTFAVKHNSKDKYTDQAQGGVFGPLPTFFYDYDVKDTRRDVTCVPYQWASVTDFTTAKQVLYYPTTSSPNVNIWFFGKLRYEWMKRHVTSTNDDGLNFVYMRYAEVLMMAAEIENEIGTLDNAKGYLKQIRQRAFAQSDWTAKVDNYLASITTKDQMFTAIVNEHAFEFAGEELRKQALIRWNLLGTNVKAAVNKMRDLSNLTGNYSDVPSTLYYRYASDGETLQIYGLNRGETDDMSGSYAYTAAYISTTKLTEAKIVSLYTNDPDKYQFWPIWQVFIDSSNGMLTNDYGY
jgi:starch-binding outer membrane protein, SusD/RagB family